MKTYFFDLVSGQRSEYDHRGHNLPSVEAAHQVAELIALDLGIEPDGKWCGWTIKVQNAYGRQVFSIPVQEDCLAAA
jgi:hypothetical protein